MHSWGWEAQGVSGMAVASGRWAPSRLQSQKAIAGLPPVSLWMAHFAASKLSFPASKMGITKHTAGV